MTPLTSALQLVLVTQAPPEQIFPPVQTAPPPQVQAPEAEQPSAVAPQLAQVAPAVAQAATVRAVQVVPVQQPDGHEVALHTHEPLTHC